MTFFQWGLVFIGVVLFLWLKLRKESRRGILTERQVSVTGTRVITPLRKTTPLECLVTDDIIFGEGFKDKELPELPHSDECECSTENYVARSREWFSNHQQEQVWESDLGTLPRNQARYYKYKLLAMQENDENQKKTFNEALDSIQVDEGFRNKVENHLNAESF